MRRRGLPQPTTVEELKEGLRTSYRTGWRITGIADEHGESTWDHSLRLQKSMLLYLKHNGRQEDMTWAENRAPWHDTSDYELVDITPHDNISDEERLHMEEETVRWATARLGDQGARKRQYWLEGNIGDDPRRLLQFQLDKIEASVEAIRYGVQFPELRNARPFSLDRFYAYTRSKLTDPLLITTLDTLNERQYTHDARLQYNTLLILGADLDRFHHIMRQPDPYKEYLLVDRE